MDKKLCPVCHQDYCKLVFTGEYKPRNIVYYTYQCMQCNRKFTIKTTEAIIK